MLRCIDLVCDPQEPSKVDHEIDTWFAKLDMQGWGKKKIKDLSKGMSQKVQFLATIVSGPDLILLDEPFSGLDPVNAEAIKDAILELRGRGTTVIFSTHDMNSAERMCDFIFMIYQGRKVLDGTLSTIQDEYGSDTIRVRVEDGAGTLQDLPGVEGVNDFGQQQELRISPACDTQDVLGVILERTRVHSFEVARPSLRNIFVRIAKPGVEATQDPVEPHDA